MMKSMNVLKILLAVVLYVVYAFLIYVQPVFFVSLFVTTAIYLFNVKMSDDLIERKGEF